MGVRFSCFSMEHGSGLKPEPWEDPRDRGWENMGALERWRLARSPKEYCISFVATFQVDYFTIFYLMVPYLGC